MKTIGIRVDIIENKRVKSLLKNTNLLDVYLVMKCTSKKS